MPTTLSTLAIAGHPLGLPLKISSGVTITDNGSLTLFRATLDGDTGESGAPVFDYATGKVEGVHTALIQPRFDVRTGGAPGGGDCLVWRNCAAGSCNQNANASTATRTTFADDNIVRFGKFQPPTWAANDPSGVFFIAGPGSRYSVSSGGFRTFTTSTAAGTLIDTDGDTLPDSWETSGVTVTVGGQPVFVDLPAMGANPNHKDLFVQLDWMANRSDGVAYQLPADGMDMMRQSFEAAPVWNPDGEPGIRLHLDAGPGSKTWDRSSRAWVDWPDTATAACGTGCVRRARSIPYSKYFGPSICTVSGCDAQLNFQTGDIAGKIQTLGSQNLSPFGRNTIFFYGVSVDQMFQLASQQLSGTATPDRTPGSTEITYGASGRNFGNGFVVSLGVNCPVDNAPALPGCTAAGTVRQRAQTTQHEFGHSMSLAAAHNGDPQDVGSSRKPNYMSIMGYLYQLETFNPVDYSRHTLPTLTESALDESVGDRDPDGRTTSWRAPSPTTGFTATFNTSAGDGAVMPAAFPGAIDWNLSGFGITPAQPPETNTNANIDGLSGTPVAAFTVHKGWNDWAHLTMQSAPVQASGIPGNGTLNDITVDELDTLVTAASRAELAQLPTASFRLSKQGTRAPVTVSFDAGLSRNRQTSVVEYDWDFNDGSTTVTTTPTVTHQFRRPGTFVARLLVKDSAGNVSRFPASERVRVDAPVAPSFMGFEDPARPWTVGGTPPPLDATRTTEGSFSQQIPSCVYTSLVSPTFITAEMLTVGDHLAVDVFVPPTSELSNPAWVGDIGLFANIPAAGINNLSQGATVGLTTLPRGTFTTVTFPLTSQTRQALLGDWPGAQLTLAVNSGSCRSALLLDNVRMSGTLTPRTTPHRTGSQGINVVTSPLLGFENTSDWSSAQTTVAGNAVLKTEGSQSLAAPVTGWTEIRSRAFSAAEITGETATMNLDLFIAQPQPNPFWVGDVQLAFDCPAAGINNLTIGAQSLTNRFLNEFNALAYTLPANVLGVLRGSATGCRWLIWINATTGAGTFYLDRFGFVTP